MKGVKEKLWAVLVCVWVSSVAWAQKDSITIADANWQKYLQGLVEQVRKEKKLQAGEEVDVKVGLVLSGGGAKGFAHISVLKAIEEAGVRIDYIGGTSMGALVGGLYAVGYSAPQLDSIFNKIDFDKILYDYMPRGVQSFYEKDKRERYAVSFPLREGKLGMPAAVSKGYNLYSFLNQLTIQVREVEDFSKLPTPFLCIATDVLTSDGVVLERGNLAEAMMASASLPMLLPPMQIEEKLLTDGGAVNNYPVDEVKAKGMDIIIGVDIQAPSKRLQEIHSGLDVMGQITSYKIVGDMARKIKHTHIYIRPNVSPYNPVSFDKGRAIIDSGAVAAYKMMPRLQEIARYQKNHQPRRHLPVVDSLKVSNVSFVGNERYSAQYLQGKLGFQPNEKIGFNDLTQGMLSLLATDNFSSVRYQVCPSEEGDEVSFQVKEKKENIYVRLSGRYDNLYRTSILLGITKEHLLQQDDHLSFDFILSNNLRYRLDYHVDKGYYSSYGVRSYLDAFSHDMPLTKNTIGEELFVRMSTVYNQAYMESIWAKKFLVGLGLEHRHHRASSGSLSFRREDFASVYSYLRFDTLDDNISPMAGVMLQGLGHLYFHQWQVDVPFTPFLLAHISSLGAIPLSERVSLGIGAEIGFHLGDTNSGMLSFLHGGEGVRLSPNYINMLGYKFMSLSSYDFIKLKTQITARIGHRIYANAQAHFMNAQDGLFSLEYDIYRIQQTGYGLGLVWRLPIAPLELNYSYSPEVRKHLVYVSLGYRF